MRWILRGKERLKINLMSFIIIGIDCVWISKDHRLFL